MNDESFDFESFHLLGQQVTMDYLFIFSEAERRIKEDAERKAKLDAIAERQRQREQELDEKARLQREALLNRATEPVVRAFEPPSGARHPEPVAAAAAPAAAAASSGKYVPRFRRGGGESVAAPPPEADRWGSSRTEDRPPPAGDRWRRDDSRGGASRPTWSSSRRG